MKLADLAKTPAKRIMGTVLGCDISTHSLAFCLYNANGKPIRWGEIDFVGDTVFERLSDGQKKVRASIEYLTADLIVFESAVYVQNKKTVILLAYAFGAIIAALIESGSKVESLSPIEWQRAISNPPLTKIEKETIKKDNPLKSASWYQNKGREIRKQRTIDWTKKTFGMTVTSDNVSDAIALGHVGYRRFIKPTTTDHE